MSDEEKIKNMANLNESIPKQLIEEHPRDEKYWEEVVLPLIRKVFKEIKER